MDPTPAQEGLVGVKQVTSPANFPHQPLARAAQVAAALHQPMLLVGVGVELGARGEMAQPLAKAELEGRASHSHLLTPQLCLQLGVGAGDPPWVVQVLLMAQELEPQAPRHVMVPMGLTTEAMEAEEHTTRAAPVAMEAQASSSSATELLGTSWYLWGLSSLRTCLQGHICF
jgi:hypothetical protein